MPRIRDENGRFTTYTAAVSEVIPAIRAAQQHPINLGGMSTLAELTGLADCVGSSCNCDACNAARQYNNRIASGEDLTGLPTTNGSADTAIVGGTNTTMQANPPVPAPPAEPTLAVAPAPMSRLEMAIAKMEKFGIMPIPDDECTDMGSYVIWNKWTPDMTLYTGRPGGYGSSWNDIEGEKRYSWSGESMDAIIARVKAENRRAHPTKPVRIKAYVNSNLTRGYIYEFTIDSSNRQVRNTYTSDGGHYDSDAYSEYIAQDKQVTLVTKIPAVMRLRKLRSLAEKLYNNDTINSTRFEQTCTLLNMMNPQWVAQRNRSIIFRGQSMNWENAQRRRDMFVEVGSLIANPEDNSESFISAMATLFSYTRDIALRNKLLGLWNDRCEGGDEITFGVCGHFHPEDEGEDVAGGTACHACFSERYVYVSDIEQYDLRDNVYEHDDGEYYSFSEDGAGHGVGGRVVGYSNDVRRTLSADMTITPSQFGDFWMGVELEVAPVDGRRKDPVLDTAKFTKGYAIMKDDGSLPSGGFEIVTAPRGLKEHIERFKAWTPHPTLRAWDTDKCGMHVHISSQAFSQSTLGKFLEFINAVGNDELIHAVAGRHPTTNANAAQYCQREGAVVVGNPKMTLAGKATNRYRMINTCNLSRSEAKRLALPTEGLNGKDYNTVELRIFRASLSKPRLLAQLEFAHAAVMFCRVASMRELGRAHFIAWLRGAAGQYPHLARWFGVRANTQAVEATPKAREAAEV